MCVCVCVCVCVYIYIWRESSLVILRLQESMADPPVQAWLQELAARETKAKEPSEATAAA